MATTTTNLGLTKPAVGADADAWGGQLNASLDVLDLSVQFGALTKSVAGAANVTLSANEAAKDIIILTGAITANIAVIFPDSPSRRYVVRNTTTGAFTVTLRRAVGTGVVLPQGATLIVVNDGGDVVFESVSNALNLQGTNTTLSANNIINRTGSQGAISGDRNRVINGSCQIVNVATFVAANNTTGYGGPELFLAINNAAGGQFTQSQGSLTFGGISLPTVRQTVNTAITSTATGNFWFGISTILEGFNVFDLRTKPVSLSFVFNATVTGSYSVSLRDGPETQSYITTFSATANTPIQVSIPLAAIPSAASIPNTNGQGLILNIGALNTGTFQTATLNTWQSGNFFTATGATNWGATAGNFIELTNLQLEEGSVATDFIRRSYVQELMLTQRYVVAYFNRGSSTRFGFGLAISTTVGNPIIPHPVEMRSLPTLTLNQPLTNFFLSDASVGTTPTSITTQSITSSRLQTLLLVNVANGLTAFRPYFFENNAGATDTVAFTLSARF